MPSVHYKFKSFLDYKTLVFEGIQISVGELKKLIYENEKIGSADYDLQISNAQTKQIYEDDSTPIQRNTSVIVARVPKATHQKLQKISDTRNEGKVIRSSTASQPSRSVSSMLPEKNDLASKSDLTEEEKLKIMQQEATQAYDPLNYQRGRNLVSSGPAPATLKCNKCGQSGHWIKDCPLLNVRRPTGIPKDELMETTPDDPQAMLTPSGRYVVSIMDKQAHLIGKKEKPPFFDEGSPILEPEPKKDIPSELTCALCNDLLRDAVLIRCCGYSFCDDCMRNRLLESDNHQCPHCGEKNISPDTLVPNSQLRKAVANFRNEAGYVYAHQQRRDVSQEKPAATSSKLVINLVPGASSRPSVAPAEQRYRPLLNTDLTSSPRLGTGSPDQHGQDSTVTAAAAPSSSETSSAAVASSMTGITASIPQASTTSKPPGTLSTAIVPPMKIVPSIGPLSWSQGSMPGPSVAPVYSAPLSSVPIGSGYLAGIPHGLPVGVPIMAAPQGMYQQQSHPHHMPPPPGVMSGGPTYLPNPFGGSQPPPPGVPSMMPPATGPMMTAQYLPVRAPSFPGPRRPMTEEEFYNAKRRMLENRFRDRYRSPRPQDAWEEFLARKDRKRKRSTTRSRSSSRSRTRSSSRSRSRSSSRSHRRSRSRSRSYYRSRRHGERSRGGGYQSRSHRSRSRSKTRSSRTRSDHHDHRPRRSSRSRSKDRSRASATSKSSRRSSPRRHHTVSGLVTGGNKGPMESYARPSPGTSPAEKKTILSSCVQHATAPRTTTSPQEDIVSTTDTGVEEQKLEENVVQVDKPAEEGAEHSKDESMEKMEMEQKKEDNEPPKKEPKKVEKKRDDKAREKKEESAAAADEKKEDKTAAVKRRREGKEEKEAKTKRGKEEEMNEGEESKIREGKESRTREGKESRTREGNESRTREGKEPRTREGKESRTRERKEPKTREGKESKTREGKESKTREGKESKAEDGKDSQWKEEPKVGKRGKSKKAPKSQEEGAAEDTVQEETKEEMEKIPSTSIDQQLTASSLEEESTAEEGSMTREGSTGQDEEMKSAEEGGEKKKKAKKEKKKKRKHRHHRTSKKKHGEDVKDKEQERQKSDKSKSRKKKSPRVDKAEKRPRSPRREKEPSSKRRKSQH